MSQALCVVNIDSFHRTLSQCSENKLGELKDNVLAGHLLVDSGERLQLVLYVNLLTLVQMNLDQTRSIELDSDTLANNLRWKAQVLEDSVMHRGESTTARTFLLVLSSRLSCWFRKNSPMSDEDNVLATELLLELSHESRLNLLIAAQLRNWHRDDDSLLTLYIYLLGSSNAQLRKNSLQVTVHFEFQESLRNGHFKFIRLLPLWLHNLCT